MENQFWGTNKWEKEWKEKNIMPIQQYNAA